MWRALLLLLAAQLANATVTFFRNDTVWEFADQAGDFGPKVPDKGVRGLLVVAYPDKYGCSAIEIEASRQFVVLVSRGPADDACTFTEKVLNSQAAGAEAVIVYNYENNLLVMQGINATDVMIPSVLVTQESGETMLEILNTAGPYDKMIVVIEPNKDTWDENHEIGYALVFVMSTSLFMCVVCFGVYVYTNSRRPPLEDLQPWKLTATMEMEEAMRLPEVTVEASNKHFGESCSICLGEFVVGDRAKLLPCNHLFHNSCIIPWLTERNAICPLCKFDLQSNSPEVDFDYHLFSSDTPLSTSSDDLVVSNGRRQTDADGLCPV